VSLNVKNPEAYRLAKEISDQTGESITTVVTEALRERLARMSQRKLAERLMGIGEQFSSRMSDETRHLDINTLLYDSRGLPK
jgi:antitoxin VapB